MTYVVSVHVEEVVVNNELVGATGLGDDVELEVVPAEVVDAVVLEVELEAPVVVHVEDVDPVVLHVLEVATTGVVGLLEEVHCKPSV